MKRLSIILLVSMLGASKTVLSQNVFATVTKVSVRKVPLVNDEKPLPVLDPAKDQMVMPFTRVISIDNASKRYQFPGKDDDSKFTYVITYANLPLENYQVFVRLKSDGKECQLGFSKGNNTLNITLSPGGYIKFATQAVTDLNIGIISGYKMLPKD